MARDEEADQESNQEVKKQPIDKIRVAHLMQVLHFGGKENGIVNIVNNTDSEIFENYIITFIKGGSLHKMVKPERCKIVSTGRKWGNDSTLPFKVAGRLRENDVHMLHTHAWSTLIEGYGGAKLARTPVIIHGEHGTMKDDSSKHRIIQRFIWDRFDKILSVSEVLSDQLAKRIGYPREKIQTLVNGVDLDKFIDHRHLENYKEIVDLPADTPVFGSVGRLVQVKNYPLLLRSAKKVFEKMPNARLLLVGAGPLYPETKAMIQELGIAEKTIFIRWRKNIPDYIRAMDVFILPSFSEGMSNTILEAMACSRTVIATDVGGNPELVDNNKTGMLVPSDDDEAMSAAIIDLLHNTEKRRTFAAAGRRKVEEQYTFQQMIRRYEKLYIELAEEKMNLSRGLKEKIARWRQEEQAIPAPLTLEPVEELE
ncbi:MAG: glycosyltransferase [Calditrichaeota bacterium]|nr:MAG: glycosyltransferase [Calditrichota bacterium]